MRLPTAVPKRRRSHHTPSTDNETDAQKAVHKAQPAGWRAIHTLVALHTHPRQPTGGRDRALPRTAEGMQKHGISVW